jgi:hypothetical protein
MAEADAVDQSNLGDFCINTTGLAVAEVTLRVREGAGRWPVLIDRGRPPREVATGAPAAADGTVLWLCGATGVGKSRVGWEVYQRARRAGLVAAFIDLDQVGFCRPAPGDDPDNHTLKSQNLAALWSTFRAAGAQCLVVVGPVSKGSDIKAYTRAVPAAALTVCRLHAGRDQLIERIRLRGQGQGWRAPGDPLRGQPEAHLLRVADKAAEEAEAMERAGLGDLRVETDRLSAEEVAAEVVTKAGGWPGLGC